MISIDLDTSCLDRKQISEGRGVIIELAKLQKEGKVKLYVNGFVRMESNELDSFRWRNVLRWIDENTSHHYHNSSADPEGTQDEKVRELELGRGYSCEKYDQVSKKVMCIILNTIVKVILLL